MKGPARRSMRFGLATAFALLLASEIAHLTGHAWLGHLLFWQGPKMHEWFPCTGWVSLLCVRSAVDWQYFTFGLVLGSFAYMIGWGAVFTCADLMGRRRVAALRR